MTSSSGGLGTQASMLGVERRRRPSVDGGSRSSRWKCAMPRNRPVGVSSGGAAHVDLAASDGRELRVADVRQRLGDGRVGRQDHRLRRHHAAGGVARRRSAAGGLGSASSRLHQLQQLRSLVSGGSSASRSAASSGVHLLEDVGGALGSRACRGSRPGRPRAAPRGRRPAARRRARRRPRRGAWADSSWITLARSAGRSVGRGRRAGARRPGRPRRSCSPLDVVPLHDVGLRRGAASPLRGARCTATRVSSQSRVRACSMATSKTVALDAGAARP